MDYQDILSEVDSWPVEERLRLVQDLWDRIAIEDDDLELTDAMKAELDRRIEELDRDPGSGIPWEVAKARILGRLRSSTFDAGEVEKAWDVELARRVEDIESGRVAGEPADQVFADLRKRFP
ncbi:addiction module protein [Tundrisphaera sp. TA3]|uniref:addiction module protein n=1 Tax=Tundrisphaera sp. TA3 TaxID=3435775 RepID=UPI003EBF198E